MFVEQPLASPGSVIYVHKFTKNLHKVHIKHTTSAQKVHKKTLTNKRKTQKSDRERVREWDSGRVRE